MKKELILFASILLFILSVLGITKLFIANCLIAHALGIFQDIPYSNSLEAFNNSYKKGYRLFEVDLTQTSDKKVVCFHSYSKDIYDKFNIDSEQFSYDDFMSGKIFENLPVKFTPLSLEDMLYLMKKYPDINVMLHIHAKKDVNITSFILDKIIEIVGNDERLFDRFIVGVNYLGEYEIIKSKARFKNLLYYIAPKRKRSENLKSIKSIIKYMDERNIKIVSIPYDVLQEKSGLKTIRKLKKQKIFIYSFTQNNVIEILKLKLMGVDVIGTDTNLELLNRD